MSRKAKFPVTFDSKVQAKVDGNKIEVKGPKASLNLEFNEHVKVEVKDQEIYVTQSENSDQKQFVGLYWSLISNLVIGVTEGFVKKLEMIGVGYRAAVQGALLDLQLGFSHPTKIPIPEGINIQVEKNTLISIEGSNKQAVGQFAATIRALRKPEPYKGKGIRYFGEQVRRKAGKSGK